MNRFAWTCAKSISEAAAAASTIVADAMTQRTSNPGHQEIAVLKAGGVDLLDLMKESLLAPTKVIGLNDIPGLDTIVEEDGGGLRIGAMVTLANLADHRTVQQRYSALADAARVSASPQIRNVATLGGNLLQRPRCWYFRSDAFHCLKKGGGHCFAIDGQNQYHAIFDNRLCAIVHPSTAATALVALGATIALASSNGDTRLVPIEEFFVTPDHDVQRENDLKPGEILTAVHVAPLSSGAHMAHVKQGEKADFDWPLADVAVLLDLASDGTCESASVILGAAAAAPLRSTASESVLLGKRIDENVAREAGHAAVQGATPLAMNAYKLPLFETLVRRAILKAVARH